MAGPYDEFKPLLDRERSKAGAKELIDLACPLLHELVNHATHAFARCTRAQDPERRGGENEDLAPIILYRQLIEQIDGVKVLLAESCSDATVPLLRSAFEASLSLSYILQSAATYTQRSLAWTLRYLHRRIEKHEQNDPATPRGAERAKVLHAFFGKPPAVQDSEASVAGLRRVLARPAFLSLEADYQARRTKKPRQSTDWFSLLDGPSNRRELAQRIGSDREAEYLVLYGEWSDITHAGDAALYLREGKRQGESAFKALRQAEQLPFRAVLAASFMLRATREMVRHFRPGEPLEPWFLREIKEPFNRLVALRVQLIDED